MEVIDVQMRARRLRGEITKLVEDFNSETKCVAEVSSVTHRVDRIDGGSSFVVNINVDVIVPEKLD